MDETGGINIVEMEEQLLKDIDKKRQEMIKTAMMNGMTSKATIKCSQELDHLLNSHSKIWLKNSA